MKMRQLPKKNETIKDQSRGRWLLDESYRELYTAHGTLGF